MKKLTREEMEHLLHEIERLIEEKQDEMEELKRDLLILNYAKLYLEFLLKGLGNPSFRRKKDE
ncbi:MAG: hypothetical protein QXP56_04520 [Archaeoglobaceae archaeon]